MQKRSNEYKIILKDMTKAIKVASTAALKAQGVVKPGTYGREVAEAAEMILHDAAVVTSWKRGGDGS